MVDLAKPLNQVFLMPDDDLDDFVLSFELTRGDQRPNVPSKPIKPAPCVRKDNIS